MNAKQGFSFNWYNGRVAAGMQVLVCLLVAYPLGLRAIDTGSLGQYSLVFVLLVLSAVGIGKLFHRQSRGATPNTAKTASVKKQNNHGSA